MDSTSLAGLASPVAYARFCLLTGNRHRSRYLHGALTIVLITSRTRTSLYPSGGSIARHMGPTKSRRACHSRWVPEVVLVKSMCPRPWLSCHTSLDILTVRSLSYMEMRLVLARMIWNFDNTNADEAIEWDVEDNMKNLKAFSTWQKPGLNVYITEVKR
jgi:hypothetical protein